MKPRNIRRNKININHFMNAKNEQRKVNVNGFMPFS